ncbi:glycosyltransferase [Vibrio aestuarianus]|uniref:glycosyltransferase family 2 protein n=1 Tax=Vibrio aestuarianus TaxID=28171 RepID=UPI00237CDE2C|nr:glycosyltransferase [Vibrio aestuarianus]MDE1326604.1 glycosyltransferase [Vibrio aestuarianus]
MSKKISVIINCYNSEEFLSECIKSVLSQTYTNFEIIFWDNQSTDRSSNIVKSFGDNRIKYLLAPKHTTLGLARNLAAEHVSGDWIAFLDCDDLWSADKLETQMNLINSSTSELGIVYSRIKLINEGNCNTIMAKQYSTLIKQMRSHAEENVYNRLLKGNYIIFSSVLLKVEAFKLVGGIDSTLQQNEDYDLLIKVAQKFNAGCCEAHLTSYRVHSNNNSIKNNYLHFEETNKILSSLQPSPELESARRLNRTRQGLYLMTQGELFKGIGVIVRHGSFSAISQIVNKRLLSKLI